MLARSPREQTHRGGAIRRNVQSVSIVMRHRSPVIGDIETERLLAPIGVMSLLDVETGRLTPLGLAIVSLSRTRRMKSAECGPGRGPEHFYGDFCLSKFPSND
jgi:hypothetical protein